MILGLVFGNRTIGVFHCFSLSIITLIGFYVGYSGLITFRDLPTWLLEIGVQTILFLWFLFNSTLIIIQLAEFFASTAGLYALWGSDRKRVFLTPLPQLTIFGIIVGSLYLLLIGRILDGGLLLSLALVLTTLIYGFLKNAGRIIRGSLALYSFFLAYLSLGYVYNFGVTQNIVMWVIITLFSTLFIAQGRAAMIAKDKEGLNGYIILLLGIVLLIGHELIPTRQGISLSISTWWMLSLIAGLLAPLAFVIYIYVSGKISFYLKRDQVPTHILFLEMASIIGSALLKELLNIVSSRVSEFAKALWERRK